MLKFKTFSLQFLGFFGLYSVLSFGVCLLTFLHPLVCKVSFSMIPKYHALKHVAFQIRSQLRRGCPRILNPQIDCCESNEDHVGKVAALSRRVSTRLLTRRVIQRYFLKTRALIVRHVKSHGAGFR